MKNMSFAKTLIKNNIDKLPSFHIDNLTINGILWNHKKITYLYYKLKEEKYPSNNIIMNNLTNQYIFLGEIKSESNQFCIIPKVIYFKTYKEDKLEHLVFITTPFQLNLLKEVNILFIDGTFRLAPKPFYQILDKIGNIPEKNLTVVILSGLMTSKSELSYINVFENLKLLVKENNIKIDFNNIHFKSDYEKGIRNGIKKTFEKSNIYGCYFHYIKSIFKKYKGLVKKNPL